MRAEQNDLIIYITFNIADINHKLVHTNSAEYFCIFAVYNDLAFIGQASGKAVCISDRNGSDLGYFIGFEYTAVGDFSVWFKVFNVRNFCVPTHYRLKVKYTLVNFIGRIKTVCYNSHSAHIKILVKIHNSGAVIKVLNRNFNSSVAQHFTKFLVFISLLDSLRQILFVGSRKVRKQTLGKYIRQFGYAFANIGTFLADLKAYSAHSGINTKMKRHIFPLLNRLV